MTLLTTPVSRLLGPRTAKGLADLGLHTVGGLLRHYPRRHAERGELTDLGDLRADEDVTVLAEIVAVSGRTMTRRKGHITDVVVSDGRNRLRLAFFNQRYLPNRLGKGRRGLFSGRVARYKDAWQLTHPAFELLAEGTDVGEVADQYAGALVPIYPASAAINSGQIARSVRTVLDVVDDIADPLPAAVRDRHGLLGFAEALRAVHRPARRDQIPPGMARLRFDEAFALQVELARRRTAARGQSAVPRVARPDGLLAAFDARLPFELTAGQRETAAALAVDLAAPRPMHRLLQGEVGSGKTVVALRAMLTVVDAGGQAVLMAPTEVLAQQHHRTVEALLGPLGQAGRLDAAPGATSTVLLTGSTPAAARRQALGDIASGTAGIVIGTHAVLETEVTFADLGLVVVDEQHRFGVEQRAALGARARRPAHLLVMTATPIPRTVAMTVFGDLDVSTLAELPAGRRAVATHVVAPRENSRHLERVWERVHEEVAAGHRGFVVCPRIGDEPGAPSPGTSVLDAAERLAAGPLRGLRLEVLHGRLAAEDKDAVMRRFAAGGLDVLVSTTVIEVGVDVPAATVMVVLDAEHFGISQLHQLRGRVGRGHAAGLCLLVTEAEPGTSARTRLEAVAATGDGFELSRLDLEQRREGDVLGAAQAGRRSSLRLLDVLRDDDLIRAARDAGRELVDADPGLRAHPGLTDLLADLLDSDRAEFLERG